MTEQDGGVCLVRITPEVEKAIADAVQRALAAALPATVAAITASLQTTIAETIRKASAHECIMDLPEEWVREIGHLVGVVADIGDGDLRKGAEEVRKHHLFLKWRTDPSRAEDYKANHDLAGELRRSIKLYRNLFLGAMATALAGGLIAAVSAYRQPTLPPVPSGYYYLPAPPAITPPPVHAPRRSE